jgi:hypothetical protein
MAIPPSKDFSLRACEHQSEKKKKYGVRKNVFPRVEIVL